ncbi:MAG: porin [Rhodospirillaceae bacterium]|nr:porin [Rhodospirillaceae bacterium]
MNPNSRVKVTVYGQVSRSVRFAFDKHNTEVHHVDQDGSGSRLGFLAQGRVDPDLAISGRIVVGWQENRRSATHDGNGPNTRLRSRHVDLWTDHKDLGQLWLGHGGLAGGAANVKTLSGTSYVFGFGGPGLDSGILATGKDGHSKYARHTFLTFTGARANRIMYVTPNVMGFRASVSHSDKDQISAGLDYAGNPFGMKNVRAVMGFGWTRLPGDGATFPGGAGKPTVIVNPAGTAPAVRPAMRVPGGGADAQAYAVSGGIMHVPTGLNISASWAVRDHQRDGTPAKPTPDDAKAFGVEVGWTGSIWGMGATSVSVGYGRWENEEGPAGPAGRTAAMGRYHEGHSERYHVAVVQNIDPAASDVYFGVSYDDGKSMHHGTKKLMEREAVVSIVTGIRIKF